MADVTVQQLADTVGTSVERLLAQMKDAGLPHSSADDNVSDEEKQALLVYLKSNHGGGTSASASPKRVTLKRKSVSTIKTTGSSGKKTVNVEVRKKRTYVKRQPAEELPEEPVVEEELIEEVEETPVADIETTETAAPEVLAPEVEAQQEAPVEAEPAPEPEVVEIEEAEVEAEKPETVEAADDQVEAPAVEEPVAEEEAQAEPEPIEEEKPRTILGDEFDLEAARQRAAARRKAEDEAHQEQMDALREKKRIEQERAKEEKKRKAEEQAAAAQREKAKKEARPSSPSPGGMNIRLKEKRSDDDNDDRNRRSRGKASKGRGKQRHHNLRVNDNYELEGQDRYRKVKLSKTAEHKKHGFEQPVADRIYTVELSGPIAVNELAKQMNIKAAEVIKSLMGMGMMATINQALDVDTAELVVEDLGHKVAHVSATAAEDTLLEDFKAQEGTLEARAPVVTVMGHVDHGKTSLLDYIRNTRVASGEAGGITQHIGAYHVETDKGMVTFLDTPGHAAFTAMRARGAQSTDIVILIVAADDGVMPQTEEAVQHARAAGVPVVVAVNKIDKEEADPDRVKNELAAQDVIPEDWGGDVQFVNVSAHTGQGIDELLEAVLLQAELLELTAAKDVDASGVVIESRLDKGRGVVTSILVQQGTLRVGDHLLAGSNIGRVRAMSDENGKPIKEAGPSIPVEILGLDGTPNAGDEFYVVADERKAREVAAARADKERETRLARQQSGKLENLFANMGQAEKRSLAVLLKTDVRGSLEAIQNALLDLGNDEVEVNIIASGVGGISETDINLAITSNAVVFGFNVRADNAARDLVEQESVDMRYYSVIYDLIDDVKQSLSGMLSPEMREEIVGVAEVREVFKSPKFGLIAGSMVVEGTIYRNKPIRVLRDNVVIYEGELESLRRFKDDVQEVRNGMECGIGVKNYQDVRAGDKIEVFDVKEIARSL